MPPLTVLLTTHNRLEYTKRTMKSLLFTIPADTEYVLVDNCSTENGFEEYLNGMEELGIKIIRMEENKGWGAAVNEGLRYCNTEYILVTNNDVEYKQGWFEQSIGLYGKYPQIGILGVWKHTAHGVREDLGDIQIKDDMPAVGWLVKRSVLDQVGDFPEHGPCSTKGGNGEDSAYVNRVHKEGLWVVGPKEDIAVHIDGY